jgi:hypothetical protein
MPQTSRQRVSRPAAAVRRPCWKFHSTTPPPTLPEVNESDLLLVTNFEPKVCGGSRLTQRGVLLQHGGKEDLATP